MPFPPDYVERVYAGVLGKIIGVYLGRPFEGWSHERILAELGEIDYYVHERLGLPLVVTDDDISGTFTFLRALRDYGNTRELTPAQIGQTWLNYIIENRTILWWGGMGNSTEHTAYLRLKSGIPAPHSGSIDLNGKVVAEQIGAEIFIDGWGMVAPGDPALAADLARRAASVSHDGEAIYGAQVVAAMEAQAFVERDVGRLIDTGLSFIPGNSVIRQMARDLRAWRTQESDWRSARELLAARYGYDRYGGNCHVIPNHGLILLSLLYGDGDFQRSLRIVNGCGWDTDCNSGNVGCLLGIRNGLAGIEDGPDWRAPVADRLYLPTADGGGAITDAVAETFRIVNTARGLASLERLAPKGGARFHFDLPGAVQGFRPEASPPCRGVTQVENSVGQSRLGERSLAIRFHHLSAGRLARAATTTFIPADAATMGGYSLIASPTLYPGQTVRARVVAGAENNRPVGCRLYLQIYDALDRLADALSPEVELLPGAAHEFNWLVPPAGGFPIAAVGVELSSARRADGSAYLDYLTWDGGPDVALERPAGGSMWRRAWVQGVDHFDSPGSEPYRLIQDRGAGLLIQGAREWTDYRVTARITPHMVASAGIGARVQGMRRYYALLLCRGGCARLVKALDGDSTLEETLFPWELGTSYELALEVVGNRLQGWIDGRRLFDARDADRPLEGGAVALICEEGRVGASEVRVQPAGRASRPTDSA
jgi:ADP-ribosylglycohydrolase